MAETVDIGIVTRSFRSALDETAGQFRKAANDNSVNLAKIVKDISAMFKAQRGDIAELTNAVQESVSESQQTAAKIDIQTSIFREFLTMQSEMTTYLKTMSGNVKILNDNVVSLQNAVTQTGPNTLLGGLLNPGTGLANSLKLAGIGAAAGVAGATGASYLMNQAGVGGSSGAGGQSTGKGEYTPEKAAGLIRQAGGSEEEARILGAISQPESSGNPRARLTTEREDSLGLWQINMMPKYERERLALFGLQNKEQLFDPLTNAKAALILHRKNGGYNDWSTFQAGKHVQYLQAAAKGASGEVSTSQNSSTTATNVTTPQSQAAATTPSTTTTTPTATKEEAPPPSATSPRYEGPGAESHGPIGKEQHAEKTAGAAALPSGDIVALGKALQGMSINVSEHPAFGGVNPGKHYPNSAHNDGMAIDINAPGGITEAGDPVWGRKFDELAKQIQAAGYTVLWRTRGHYDHIHAQIGGKGIRGGQSVIGGATTPDTTSPSTPTSATSMTTAAATSSGATPVSQTAVASGVSAGMSGTDVSSLMGMMGGMMPMMGGLGGIGGMIGSLLPMVGSLLGSLGNMEMPTTPQQFASQQNPIAELLQTLSGSAESGQMMNQAAVQRQAQQEASQENQAMTQQPEQRRGVETNIASNSMSGGGHGYGYNHPGDIGWPEWASMIGGNHWAEMKKYKQNMWG